jgi:hypothetical protein
MMGRVWTVACVALAAAFLMASDAAAKASLPSKRGPTYGKAGSTLQRGSSAAPRQVRSRVAYAPRAYGVTRGPRTVFADIVGDPDSGYGFYPLPPEVQYRAARYRAVHRRFWWQNPVVSAMAADAVRNPCFIPANQAYRCGVFNPIDGVGSPFFAGYYR